MSSCHLASSFSSLKALSLVGGGVVFSLPPKQSLQSPLWGPLPSPAPLPRAPFWPHKPGGSLCPVLSATGLWVEVSLWGSICYLSPGLQRGETLSDGRLGPGRAPPQTTPPIL